MFEYRISQHVYYRKGNSPKIFFCSGIHGDEHAIIPLLTEVLLTHENSLPDFLYIPHMSPSANVLKTRENKYGHDLNRSFKNNYPPEGDSEIDTIVEILDNYILTFIDGYNHMLCHNPEAKSGFLSDYLLLVSKQSPSCMTLEVPTPATTEQKKFILEEFIKSVILSN